LAPNQSVTFRYRTVITSGKVTDKEYDDLAKDFANQ
jgi:hypothetical protein